MKARGVTVEDLEYGLGILAQVLDTQGDAVWPLFERLERELTGMQDRRERVEKHLRRKSPANNREENKSKASLKQAC